MPLTAVCTVIGAGEDERKVGRFLQAEMWRLHGIRLRGSRTEGTGLQIVLALSGTAEGDRLARAVRSAVLWKNHAAKEEAYLLEVGLGGTVIVAKTPRGLLHGARTLLQLVTGGGSGPKALVGAQIVDYPQLSFRGLHICIFPDTELEIVRRQILAAARFKYNAVALEFWSSLKSKRRPETAYENAYTPDQIRPLIQLGRSLQLEMIPALNSWGHASGMRSRSGHHAVLDRFPQMKDLYEPGGWSFCLSNPDIYPHLFDRYDELLELFENPKYFHAGMDEAWGYEGYAPCERCKGKVPHELIAAHIRKIHEYFAKKNIRVLMWHDMFVERDHPRFGRTSPANSVPPVNSHLALASLPKDVIIDAWNYSDTKQWPIPQYFRELGYPVVVSPWKTRANSILLVNIAKQFDLTGVLHTTWDSLDMLLPSIGESGVLAWTEPGFDLNTVPFEHWVSVARQLPLCNLPGPE